MTIVSTRARARKPGIRVRGYRIAVHFAGAIRPAQLTDTIWSADIPDLWNEVQQNEQVVQAAANSFQPLPERKERNTQPSGIETMS